MAQSFGQQTAMQDDTTHDRHMLVAQGHNQDGSLSTQGLGSHRHRW